jgi:hypothetical protein
MKHLHRRFPSSICTVCRDVFSPLDRRIPIFIVEGLGPHQSGVGMNLFVSDEIEFRHASCEKPGLKPLIYSHKPKRLRGIAMFDPNKIPPPLPRFPTYCCAICQKNFEVGDRIEQAYIIAGIGNDPETGCTEAIASPNIESIHVRCNDPKLTGIGTIVI